MGVTKLPPSEGEKAKNDKIIPQRGRGEDKNYPQQGIEGNILYYIDLYKIKVIKVKYTIR